MRNPIALFCFILCLSAFVVVELSCQSLAIWKADTHFKISFNTQPSGQ